MQVECLDTLSDSNREMLEKLCNGERLKKLRTDLKAFEPWEKAHVFEGNLRQDFPLILVHADTLGVRLGGVILAASR